MQEGKEVDEAADEELQENTSVNAKERKSRCGSFGSELFTLSGAVVKDFGHAKTA